MARDERRGFPLIGLVGLVVAALVVALAFVGARAWLGKKFAPAPEPQQCRVTIDGSSTSLNLEQSGNAAIITAESIRRGLPARAASIALATAMQESGLRNLNYGDRDSVGLFQQRPSQGWGTVDQIMDPWYSAGKFYDELVKVKGWQSGDINDVAQAVQRSGVPDGYRKHVEKAKLWGSALTGHSPASVSCIDRGSSVPVATNGTDLVKKAFKGTVTASVAQGRVTLVAKDQTRLWAAAQLLMMTTDTMGVTSVTIGGQSWTMDSKAPAVWQGTATKDATEAVLTLRA